MIRLVCKSDSLEKVCQVLNVSVCIRAAAFFFTPLPSYLVLFIHVGVHRGVHLKHFQRAVKSEDMQNVELICSFMFPIRKDSRFYPQLLETAVKWILRIVSTTSRKPTMRIYKRWHLYLHHKKPRLFDVMYVTFVWTGLPPYASL